MSVLKKIVCITFFLLFSCQAFSQTRLNYRGYSVRALGMGNAYTAIVDNSDAIYYNPAGLSRIQGMHLTIMDPYLGINDISDIQDTITDANDSSDADSFVTLIRDLYGENLWFGGGAKVAFSMKGLAVAYYSQAELSAYMTNPAYPTLDLTYKQDTGFHLGFSFDMGMLSMGFGIRNIDRTGGSLPVSVDVLENLNQDAVEESIMLEGTGVGLDFGLLFSGGGVFDPSIAFTWHNVGDVNFTASGSGDAPTTETGYMSLGLGMNIDLPLVNIRPALDYKFIDYTDVELAKKLDLGVEIDLPLVTARAGMHHGYYTLGASMDLFFMKLDLATFAEELGGYAGQREDRRYMLQFTLELGVDSGFNFFTMDSKARRKLKQRR